MEGKKQDPQSLGSILTYLRRYMLSSFAGISADDDDGNSASGKSYPQPPQNPQPPQQPLQPQKQAPINTGKIVEAFAGLGMAKADLEGFIGKSLIEMTQKDLSDLQGYFKEVKSKMM